MIIIIAIIIMSDVTLDKEADRFAKMMARKEIKKHLTKLISVSAKTLSYFGQKSYPSVVTLK